MPRRTVYFSSLSNKIIDDENDVVRVVVERHPALEEGQAVELDVSIEEGEKLVKSDMEVVSLKVHRGGQAQTVVMGIEEFNALAGDGDMETVLQEAEPAYVSAARPVPVTRSAPTTSKIDYSSLEHAGTPHRGRITDAEKDIVRNNLRAINERLRRDGVRTIDVSNAEHVTKYGL